MTRFFRSLLLVSPLLMACGRADLMRGGASGSYSGGGASDRGVGGLGDGGTGSAGKGGLDTLTGGGAESSGDSSSVAQPGAGTDFSTVATQLDLDFGSVQNLTPDLIGRNQTGVFSGQSVRVHYKMPKAYLENLGATDSSAFNFSSLLNPPPATADSFATFYDLYKAIRIERFGPSDDPNSKTLFGVTECGADPTPENKDQKLVVYDGVIDRSTTPATDPYLKFDLIDGDSNLDGKHIKSEHLLAQGKFYAYQFCLKKVMGNSPHWDTSGGGYFKVFTADFVPPADLPTNYAPNLKAAASCPTKGYKVDYELPLQLSTRDPSLTGIQLRVATASANVSINFMLSSKGGAVSNNGVAPLVTITNADEALTKLRNEGAAVLKFSIGGGKGGSTLDYDDLGAVIAGKQMNLAYEVAYYDNSHDAAALIARKSGLVSMKYGQNTLGYDPKLATKRFLRGTFLSPRCKF